MLIRIHAVVAENSVPYYQYMIANFTGLASGRHELRFIAHCVDPRMVPVLERDRATHQVVDVFRTPEHIVVQNWKDQLRYLAAKVGIPHRMAGSNGHSAGLSSALSMTGDGAIDLVADTDTVMLARDWDQFVVDELGQVGILGTCYEDIGGYSSGAGKVQTYKRKPTLTWFALSPRYNWRNLDPRPAKARNLIIDTPEMSALYNLPIGFELVRDVGWTVPSYLQENNIPFAVLEHVKPTSDQAQVLKTGIDYHEEFQLHGRPFVAHQRGSHRHPFRGNDISSSFYAACDAHMLDLGVVVP